jgi:prevent-host-death family protein
MKQTTVNVRELKARLSHYLRLAKAGEAVEITERGVPIGRIVPVAAPIEDRLDAMVRSGLLQWDERRLPRTAPVARARGPRSVADLLIEDRE